MVQHEDNDAHKLKVEELEQKHDTLMLKVLLFEEKVKYLYLYIAAGLLVFFNCIIIYKSISLSMQHEQDITTLELKVTDALVTATLMLHATEQKIAF